MTKRGWTNNKGFVHYRLHRAGGSAVLTVPAGMHKRLNIPEGTVFRPELTEEGILFRFVSADDESYDPGDFVPEWAKFANEK